MSDADDLRGELEALRRERVALRAENVALKAAIDRPGVPLAKPGTVGVETLRAVSESLWSSERLSRGIFDGALDAMLLANDAGAYVDANAAACELLGIPRDELVGRRVEHFSGVDYEGLLPSRTTGDAAPRRGIFPFARPDGARVMLEYSATPHILPGLHLSVLRDVTARWHAAEARNHLASIIDSSLDAIVGEALDGTITSWNRSAESLYGYTAAEAVGRPVTLLSPDERRHEAADLLRRVKRGEVVERLETLQRRKDGTTFEAFVAASPIRDAAGEIVGAATMSRDLTEQRRIEVALRRTEEQLRQSQKMEAVGRLAGGVAHDFNNMLSVILGYAAFLLDGMPADDPGRADVGEMVKAGERAAGLTRQLLAFSRQQVLEPRVLDLNDVLAGMEKMLRRVLGEDIEMAVVPADRLGRVRADPGQVEQVLMNLVVNARDAMPRGGKLTIETANVVLDGDYADAHLEVTPGAYVMVAVSDTGHGMDAATRARIFEPFFTTKEVGRGTGLGLSTTLGIVRQSGGHVWVYSEPGQGTTFKVYLPSTRDAFAAPSVPPPSARSLRGTETVLLVEDEEQVRALASLVLRRAGYTVLEAQNGGEALLLDEQHPGAVDLLLTDVVMPRLSGRQLSERLRARRPKLKVLFMSGYTDEAVFHHGVLEVGAAFLQKPVSRESLLRRVRDVLDAS